MTIDVLAVMDTISEELLSIDWDGSAERLDEARVAVANLIEAAKEARALLDAYRGEHPAAHALRGALDHMYGAL